MVEHDVISSDVTETKEDTWMYQGDIGDPVWYTLQNLLTRVSKLEGK